MSIERPVNLGSLHKNIERTKNEYKDGGSGSLSIRHEEAEEILNELVELRRVLKYAAKWGTDRLNYGFATCPSKDMTPEYLMCYWRNMSDEQ